MCVLRKVSFWSFDNPQKAEHFELHEQSGVAICGEHMATADPNVYVFDPINREVLGGVEAVPPNGESARGAKPLLAYAVAYSIDPSWHRHNHQTI
jgi:hypothetical protein